MSWGRRGAMHNGFRNFLTELLRGGCKKGFVCVWGVTPKHLRGKPKSELEKWAIKELMERNPPESVDSILGKTVL